MKNGDEPAFPTLEQVHTNAWNTVRGLTKREYFAVMAMQGLLANPYLHNDADFDLNNAADVSVRSADALIKQLES